MSAFRPIPVADKPSTKLPLWFRIKRWFRRFFPRRPLKLVPAPSPARKLDTVSDWAKTATVATNAFMFNKTVTRTKQTTAPAPSNCPRCAAMFLDAFAVNGGTTLQCRSCGWSRLG
jgi:hypothetical protein